MERNIPEVPPELQNAQERLAATVDDLRGLLTRQGVSEVSELTQLAQGITAEPVNRHTPGVIITTDTFVDRTTGDTLWQRVVLPAAGAPVFENQYTVSGRPQWVDRSLFLASTASDPKLAYADCIAARDILAALRSVYEPAPSPGRLVRLRKAAGGLLKSILGGNSYA